MTATSTSVVNTTNEVIEQVEALSHIWDDYFYPPCETSLWPSLGKMARISECLLHASKAILINVLPAAIPLQMLIYFDGLGWTTLALDALLVLEVGPCRILTRLVDSIAPYPDEGILEPLPETMQVALIVESTPRRIFPRSSDLHSKEGRIGFSRT